MKILFESQTAICLREIIQPPTKYKLSASLEQKSSNRDLQEYTNICFQVLQECSPWASRNGAVQMLFLTPTRNIRNMFLVVLREDTFRVAE